MASDVTHPHDRPDIIVPDTTPLVHLALADQLHLLHEVGGTVVVVDVVADEAVRDRSKPGTDRAAMVLYENGRVPGIVANQGLDADIDVVTMRAFLEVAERRGLIPSAAETWQLILAQAPTANPRIQASLHRRPRAVPKRDDGRVP